MLLIDSETPIASNQQPNANTANHAPWSHLAQRQGDGWEKPANSADHDCHLMVQVMESWFLADRDTLKTFFGTGFKEHKLPPANRSIETIAKSDLYRALHEATADCKAKSPYNKANHSFKLLAAINPQKLAAASDWARRFIDELKRKMD
ncbi:MAG TPA: DUF4276 family protein [Acidiphilium sp.]|nr:DUF4276 family protein [Acidiphilium sp.]HQU23297.1 DUF4276 family protein [Acidiphilium sp.]